MMAADAGGGGGEGGRYAAETGLKGGCGKNCCGIGSCCVVSGSLEEMSVRTSLSSRSPTAKASSEAGGVGGPKSSVNSRKEPGGVGVVVSDGVDS